MNEELQIMGKIVLGSIDKFDFRTSLENIKILASCEQLPEESEKEVIFVAPYTSENLHLAKNRANQVYIPAEKLTVENKSIKGLHTYFDLETYPFYQKVRVILEQEDNPKGVFRFRRMTSKRSGNGLISNDLYILSALLGTPQDIKIRQTDSKITPIHSIITVNFGGGKMAHVEYTMTNQERIELEWSGIKNIIEFDSNEMRPMQPENESKLPLTYSINSVVCLAHKVDDNLINRLKCFEDLISGGVHK